MIKVYKNKKYKILSVFLSVVVVFISIFSFSPSIKVEAKSLAELEKEAAALEQKIKDTNKQLQNAANNIKKEKEKQALLETQIGNVQDQILLLIKKIDTCTLEIENKKLEIKNKEMEIEINEDLFAQRVRALYIAHSSSSTMTTLLESNSFADFLNRADTLKRISMSDKQLVDTLASQKADLDKVKAELEARNKELIADKNNFANKEKNLSGLYKQSAGKESELLELQKQYVVNKQKYAKQQKALEDEIDRVIAEANNNGTSAPEGAYKWPVPSSSRITSPFGWRYLFGNREFHTGIDIGAGRGTPIVAAHNGTVILVTKSNYGYGWHLVIDHGGGYSTLYAHTSNIYVSVGDKVTRGQTVAEVGSTGNSTGNHLHFEVRVNNVKKDPMGYVRKP